MLLQQIFDQLTFGELAQLHIGGGELGAIDSSNYPRLINHINLGLTDLHTKFPLKEREMTVQQYDNLSYYKLSSTYAVSNPNEPPDGLPKYIIDTAENPFTDDIIRIEQVFDEVGGVMPLNQPDHLEGAFTPAYNVIQFPQSVSSNAVYITYRANHAPIPVDTTPATKEIELPDSHLQALLFFVAWRLFASVTGNDTSAVSQEYQAKYFAEVSQIKKYNLNLEFSSTYNKRILVNGWA